MEAAILKLAGKALPLPLVKWWGTTRQKTWTQLYTMGYKECFDHFNDIGVSEIHVIKIKSMVN